MKSIIFVLITIAALSSCKGECKYDEPIEGFFVTHWEEALPKHGKVYSFKAGTNFIAPLILLIFLSLKGFMDIQIGYLSL